MSEGISLGWNCNSATQGVNNGLRRKKADGYMTCPFDKIISNYKGIIQCIKDDFISFLDTDYLEVKNIVPYSGGASENFIYNKKYKFVFNHESPGHANLYITENWEKGINHFVMNNFEEFINRYRARIQNFKNLINSDKHINFLITRPKTKKEDLYELTDVLKNKYPNLSFDYIIFEKNYNNTANLDEYEYFKNHMIDLGIDEDDAEIKRLFVS